MAWHRIASGVLVAVLSMAHTGVFAQVTPTPTATPISTVTPTPTETPTVTVTPSITPTGTPGSTPAAVPLSPEASAGLVFLLALTGLWLLLRRKPNE